MLPSDLPEFFLEVFEWEAAGRAGSSPCQDTCFRVGEALPAPATAG
jgi:hypothetical protein